MSLVAANVFSNTEVLDAPTSNHTAYFIYSNMTILLRAAANNPSPALGLKFQYSMSGFANWFVIMVYCNVSYLTMNCSLFLAMG
jgi:hypothetical protein